MLVDIRIWSFNQILVIVWRDTWIFSPWALLQLNQIWASSLCGGTNPGSSVDKPGLVWSGLSVAFYVLNEMLDITSLLLLALSLPCCGGGQPWQDCSPSSTQVWQPSGLQCRKSGYGERATHSPAWSLVPANTVNTAAVSNNPSGLSSGWPTKCRRLHQINTFLFTFLFCLFFPMNVLSYIFVFSLCHVFWYW